MQLDVAQLFTNDIIQQISLRIQSTPSTDEVHVICGWGPCHRRIESMSRCMESMPRWIESVSG
jgi:hypothetical protein